MSSTGPQGISRFSSRRKRLTGMLPDLLQGATSYDRIAGYFSSSMLEVAGEAIDKMAEGSVVRVVCNSELMPADGAQPTSRLSVTNAFRQSVRWGPGGTGLSLHDTIGSPMPFGSQSAGDIQTVLNACNGNIRHQCLSAVSPLGTRSSRQRD
jgi:hypothetical protein